MGVFVGVVVIVVLSCGSSGSGSVGGVCGCGSGLFNFCWQTYICGMRLQRMQ